MLTDMDKFNHFLPGKYNIFTFFYDDRVIFYINDKKLLRDNLTTDCLAFIETITLDEDDEMCISWIATNTGYKRKGLASMLIIAATEYYKNKSQIVLDDCSDYAFIESNIYTSLGFKYINSNEPEMIGKPSTIIKKWKSFINKYGKRQFYN